MPGSGRHDAACVSLLVAFSCLFSFVAADTFTVQQQTGETMFTWENTSTWLAASGGLGLMPGANDDVVFVRQVCTVGLSLLGRSCYFRRT
jgi:hypothetical protein